jgi:hypothetical protein
MSLDMHHASIPVLIHGLRNLSAILKKGADHAKAKGIDPAVLLNARLFPDMFPLTRQVQIATDMAKGCAARLAGIENPVFPDTEASFPELQERVTRTIAFLRSVKAAELRGSESRAIQLQMRMGAITFDRGQDFLAGWVLPNFYFHLATAYNILRHNGVELSKGDFLGKVPGAVMPGAARAPAKKKKPAKAKA